jgi:conjugative transposon TraN protein
MQAQVSSELQLSVCYEKTVNLIFPFSVRSEDHGNNGIIVQACKGATHILQVKANRKNFLPTSLHVLTSDGSLYSFVVRYTDDVRRLNYILNDRDAVSRVTVAHNGRQLQEEARRVKQAPAFMHSHVRRRFSTLGLQGIFLAGEGLWLKATLVNRSTVPFPVGFVKFFIRDRGGAKNAVVQEREIFPVYQQVPDAIARCKKVPLLFAFDPFVISRSERFVMQLGEENGRRFIALSIRPRHFKRIRTLP